MRLYQLLIITSLALTTACATEVSEFEPNCDDGQCDVSSRRFEMASIIRDTAGGEGMTNAVLLAGIGEVESTLAQCWADAKWACKGPASPTCGGGPVIAGSGDGPCSLKQGGLGMFQFDAGTFSQTVRKYGNEILSLEGNVSEVLPFLTKRIVESVPGVNSREQAIAWMNSIRVVDGDPDFEQWLKFISWRYNGCKGCTFQANKYRRATHRVNREMGTSFWGAVDVREPSEHFIGTDCGEDANICDFEAGGQEGACVDWFEEDGSGLNGFCSLSCEGSCPEQDGSAPTFCADLKNDPGMCAVTPSNVNNFCADIAGSVIQVVPRFVGNSSVSMDWTSVCAPPGNALACESSEGLAGECVDTETMGCSGTLHSGACPGGNNIQCCTP